MNFIKVDGKELILSILLKECINCHKPMLGWSDSVPEYLIRKLKSSGISKEVYGDFGICKTCVDERDFPRSCECCGMTRMFPSEFEYQITDYAKYPDDETEFFYICKNCVEKRPKAVMDMLAEADDSSRIEGKRK